MDRIVLDKDFTLCYVKCGERIGFPYELKKIPLTQGYVAIVDDEDYDKAMQYKWSVHKKNKTTKYAIGNLKRNGRWRTRLLHRFILGDIPDGKEVDHINGNGLDNRKNNLRIVTHQQNAFNRGKNTKGVCWHKQIRKWQAQIKINQKQIYLGIFENLQDAIKARETAVCKYFGEFDARKEERVGILYG